MNTSVCSITVDGVDNSVALTKNLSISSNKSSSSIVMDTHVLESESEKLTMLLDPITRKEQDFIMDTYTAEPH